MTSEQQKLVIGILTVSLLAIIIYFISSCGCKKKKNDTENYVKEFTGVAKSSTFLYRPYTSSMEENPQDRCKFCKGYNNYSFESFESFEPFENTDFKLCPHNCREYGVALCNSQGKMM